MMSGTKFHLIAITVAILINCISTIPHKQSYLKASDVSSLILTNDIVKDSENVTFTREEYEAVIKDVPKSEQDDFLRYHLMYGFILKDNKNLSRFLSAEQSVKLFNYLDENYKISNENTTKLLKTTVCFPLGCIDIDDPGVHP